MQVDNEKEFKTLQSQVSDAERFAAAKLLLFRCRHCSCEYNFDGALKNSVRHLVPLSSLTLAGPAPHAARIRLS